MPSAMEIRDGGASRKRRRDVETNLKLHQGYFESKHTTMPTPPLTVSLSDGPTAKRPRVLDEPDYADGSRPTTRRVQTAPERLASQAYYQVSVASILTPCHICHRRPVTRLDLDAYLECERCGERTCDVCARECPGWAPGTVPAEDTMAKAQDEEEERVVVGQYEDSYVMRDVGDGIDDLDDGAGHVIGRKRAVCSRCCVERGCHGDVVCFGCLARDSR